MMSPITADKAPMRAGMLENDIVFRRYAALRNGFPNHEFSGTAATEHLRTVCQIASRKELASNPAAFKRFQALLTDFEGWASRIPTPR